ncbi:MAG: Na(+)-translocating NADH-quinone reductase subunit A [Bacteroidales bacterium]|nr:Na(+)-translocating NADH-quinone reductase subunit A [Bacteroidales bacterium]
MSKNIVLKKGLDIPVEGAAELRLSKTVAPLTVAVEPTALKGFTPRLLVKEGDRVLAGSPVMSDKKNADILLASPVSGTVSAIVRGDKRKLLAVLVQADDRQEYLKSEPKCTTAEEVKQSLLSGGLWPLIIQRPYGIVADPAAEPKAIFVSAFNTAPLAACTEFTLADRIADIQAGVNALAKIAKVSVGVQEGSAFAKLENAEVNTFKGKHPAGNVGVQIASVCPIRKGEAVWTISLAGLAAVGRFFTKGIYDVRRKVAVSGPAAIEPAYVETVPGTPMKCLAGFFGGKPEGVRIATGDLLTGKTVGEDGYLGFFDDTVTIIREGTDKEWFGWALPIRWKQYSADHSYFSWLTPWRKYEMDTNLHGGPRAFVMNDSYYSKVLPMDGIFPTYLIKACLAGDIDKMEKFGIYQVLPEDFALCEYIDPSKNYIQDIIAQGIDLMLKEMA